MNRIEATNAKKGEILAASGEQRTVEKATMNPKLMNQ
jgi:hypothetical protein